MHHIRGVIIEACRIALPALILAVGVGGFLVFGQRPEVDHDVPEDTAVTVRSSEVKPAEAAMTIEVDGVAMPYRQVTLSAEVGGRVRRKEVRSRAGSYVEEGEFLLEIDPTDYDLEVSRFQRELAHAREEVTAAEIDIRNTAELIALAKEDLELRQRELTRKQSLLATSAISESELDAARRDELAARNALQTLQNELASLRQRKRTLEAAQELVAVNLERAEVDRRRTEVYSTLSGTVNKDYVEEGDYVTPGDPLFLLSEASRMEVKCNLRVDQLHWVWLQSERFHSGAGDPTTVFEIPPVPVQVVLEYEGTDYQWEGVLSRYEGSGLDPDTRLIPCRVRIDAPTQVHSQSAAKAGDKVRIPALYSGMYVRVRIPIDAPSGLLAIAPQALRPGGSVWVNREGKLAVERVDVVMTQSDRILVRPLPGGALAAGDRAIASPVPNAQPGMAVNEWEDE